MRKGAASMAALRANQVLVERATSNSNREVVGSSPTRATYSQWYGSSVGRALNISLSCVALVFMVGVIGNWRPPRLWLWNPERGYVGSNPITYPKFSSQFLFHPYLGI